jgi:hypothetical protein
MVMVEWNDSPSGWMNEMVLALLLLECYDVDQNGLLVFEGLVALSVVVLLLPALMRSVRKLTSVAVMREQLYAM